MLDVPIRKKIIAVALLSVNANHHIKFLLLSLISFGDIKGVPK